MKSDNSTGRFTKEEKKENFITLSTTFQTFLFYFVIILLLLPWIAIILRHDLINKMISIFDKLLLPNTNIQDLNTSETFSNGGKWKN